MDTEEAEIKKIFNEHMLSFDIIKLESLGFGEINIRIKKKEILAKYCKNNFPREMEFKSGDEVYKVRKHYVNINGSGRVVFTLQKGENILNVMSLYECENPELFANDYLTMSVDEVIKGGN